MMWSRCVTSGPCEICYKDSLHAYGYVKIDLYTLAISLSELFAGSRDPNASLVRVPEVQHTFGWRHLLHVQSLQAIPPMKQQSSAPISLSVLIAAGRNGILAQPRVQKLRKLPCGARINHERPSIGVRRGHKGMTLPGNDGCRVRPQGN